MESNDNHKELAQGCKVMLATLAQTILRDHNIPAFLHAVKEVT